MRLGLGLKESLAGEKNGLGLRNCVLIFDVFGVNSGAGPIFLPFFVGAIRGSVFLLWTLSLKLKMVGSFISDPQVGPSFAVAGWEIRGRMIR